MNTKKSTIEERCYEIISGPNKDTLFDACKYAYSKTARFAVEFGVAIGYTMPRGDPGCAYVPMNIHSIVIAGIEHENGSGESFNLHGFCKAALSLTDKTVKNYRFHAYYHTKTRKGTIVFLK